MPPLEPRTTLATVAASAGVSIATVSKVLNSRSDVSAVTRARVQDKLAEHDYAAGRRATTARPAVELFVQGTLGNYAIEVVQGVIGAGAVAGVDVVLAGRSEHRQPRGTRPPSWAREVITRGRRSAIAVTSQLTAADLATMSRARLPLVVIDPLNLMQPDVVSVGSTNFAGGLAATEHLLALGHRRIAYLGGPVTAACNQARLHGFRSAMEAAGAPVRADYVQRSHNFLYDDGVTDGAALLRLAEPPTAIFAGNDEVALGVVEAARTRGMSIPADLSLVGFDDTQVARLASPPLTTVRQPLQEMGAVALRTSLRLAAGEALDSHHVELATTLVVRGSTAPAPQARGPATR